MADLSTLEIIKASEKPTAEDFSYIYAESGNKAFIRIAKDKLKEIINEGNYTNEEIDKKISSIPKFNIEVVSSLPTTDISETTIYLVSSGDDSENLYTEYININGLWEILGTQKASFSGSAKDVTYDDTETQLGADNVQDAVGKLSDTINNLLENPPSSGGMVDKTIFEFETTEEVSKIEIILTKEQLISIARSKFIFTNVYFTKALSAEGSKLGTASANITTLNGGAQYTIIKRDTECVPVQGISYINYVNVSSEHAVVGKFVHRRFLTAAHNQSPTESFCAQNVDGGLFDESLATDNSMKVVVESSVPMGIGTEITIIGRG